MSDVVVATVAPGPSASAVLGAARRLAECTGRTVTAVHVVPAEDAHHSEALDALAARFDVPITVLTGPVEEALLDRISAPDVAAAVVGARGAPDGRRPLGHVALDLVQRSHRPVLVVPPHAEVGRSVAWQRVLVPLEGSAASTRAAIDALAGLAGDRLEPVVLHVYTPQTAPRMLDRPTRDLALWDDEFMVRFGPVGASIEHRSGVAAHEIARACDGGHADVVVLTWSQAMEPGRAAVVREVLGRSTIPILLLPAPEATAGAGG